jgi:hypothetical protein
MERISEVQAGLDYHGEMREPQPHFLKALGAWVWCQRCLR